MRDRRRNTSPLRKGKGVVDHSHDIPVGRCECLHRLLLSGRLYNKKLAGFAPPVAAAPILVTELYIPHIRLKTSPVLA